MSSKVLHYNWAPYFKKTVPGGGVSVYCKNLIDYIAQKDNWQVTFLYSGIDYSYFSKNPHIKLVRNQNHPYIPTFSLVNSPIPAPSHFAFDDPLGNVKQPELEKCFQEFLETQAPFSVIHFHNLEGLTANCLKIAKESGAKVVFSLHNYWAVCPQVNLWRLEQSHCDDNLAGRACLACLPAPPNVERDLAIRKLEYLCSSLNLDERSLPLRGLKKLYALFYKIQRPLVARTQSPLTKKLDMKGANSCLSISTAGNRFPNRPLR